jgi:alpha/beta superfamily hydrolase
VPGSLTIDGPAGSLELLVDGPVDRCINYAVVCHPHPLHEGTMDNKVAHTLARTFARNGIPAVRFNFRGVGASEGRFADGDGETEDAIAVEDWARDRWPDANVYRAGFSFGAMIAFRVASRRNGSGLVTVAPPVDRFRFEFERPDCPWLIVQGDQDEIVDSGSVRHWADRIVPPPDFQVVAGSGHFFHGRLWEISSAVESWLASHDLPSSGRIS